MFERSEAALVRSLPIRKTICGIWHPTPVRVIEEAIAVLEDVGLLGEAPRQRTVIDAGTGDGRIPAVLAALDPTRPIYGIEQDPALFAQASVNLQRLQPEVCTHIHLVEADYCETATYEACGLDFPQTGIVFNYPDGNERRLARFISEHGGVGTRLCLLTGISIFAGPGWTRYTPESRSAHENRFHRTIVQVLRPSLSPR